MDRSEPLPLSDGFGVGEHARYDNIEQVEHIIVGASFERAHECQQRRDPPHALQVAMLLLGVRVGPGSAR